MQLNVLNMMHREIRKKSSCLYFFSLMVFVFFSASLFPVAQNQVSKNKKSVVRKIQDSLLTEKERLSKLGVEKKKDSTGQISYEAADVKANASDFQAGVTGKRAIVSDSWRAIKKKSPVGAAAMRKLDQKIMSIANPAERKNAIIRRQKEILLKLQNPKKLTKAQINEYKERFILLGLTLERTTLEIKNSGDFKTALTEFSKSESLSAQRSSDDIFNKLALPIKELLRQERVGRVQALTNQQKTLDDARAKKKLSTSDANKWIRNYEGLIRDREKVLAKLGSQTTKEGLKRFKPNDRFIANWAARPDTATVLEIKGKFFDAQGMLKSFDELDSNGKIKALNEFFNAKEQEYVGYQKSIENYRKMIEENKKISQAQEDLDQLKTDIKNEQPLETQRDAPAQEIQAPGAQSTRQPDVKKSALKAQFEDAPVENAPKKAFMKSDFSQDVKLFNQEKKLKNKVEKKAQEAFKLEDIDKLPVNEAVAEVNNWLQKPLPGEETQQGGSRSAVEKMEKIQEKLQETRNKLLTAPDGQEKKQLEERLTDLLAQEKTLTTVMQKLSQRYHRAQQEFPLTQEFVKKQENLMQLFYSSMNNRGVEPVTLQDLNNLQKEINKTQDMWLISDKALGDISTIKQVVEPHSYDPNFQTLIDRQNLTRSMIDWHKDALIKLRYQHDPEFKKTYNEQWGSAPFEPEK